MIERIKDAIEKEAMQTGAMGTESVSVTIRITDVERLEFLEECDQLDEHYVWWDIDFHAPVNGSDYEHGECIELNVTYRETI